jgi:hypothetical protein
MTGRTKISDRLLANSRRESFRVDVLHAKYGSWVEQLDGVSGGTITAAVDARIKVSGILSVKSKNPPAWYGDKLLRVSATVNGQSWVLGTFIPSIPSVGYGDGIDEFDIELNDKLLFLEQAATGGALAEPKGRNIAQAVSGHIRQQAGTFYANVPDTGRVLHRNLVWDAGTPYLTIINDMLDYMGYFSLSCDPFGNYYALPYQTPKERPLKYRWEEGAESLFEPEITWTHDMYNVPNKVVYIVQAAGDSAVGKKAQSFHAEAENRSNGPYSYMARGRWITEIKTDVDADSQATLQKMVDRRLARASNPVKKVELKHALVPLMLNDVVWFKAHDLALYTTVRKFEIDLTPGSLMSVVLRGANRDDNES